MIAFKISLKIFYTGKNMEGAERKGRVIGLMYEVGIFTCSVGDEMDSIVHDPSYNNLQFAT